VVGGYGYLNERSRWVEDEIYLGRASMKTPMPVWSVIDHVKGKRSDLVVDHGSLGVVLAALTFAGLYGRQVSIDSINCPPV
jgi:hypothetical protein